jgi:hypothetical protein
MMVWRKRVILVVGVVGLLLSGSWSHGETGGEGGRPDSLAAEPETVAVATGGILYLYGNRMEPPFVFVLERDTIWVNGYQFSPSIRSEPPPVIEVTRTDSLEFDLRQRVNREIDRLLLAGVPYDSVVSRAAEMFRGSELIDSVQVHYFGSSAELVRYWKSVPWGDYLTVRKRIPPPPRPLSEFRRNYAQKYAESLQRGSMVIWSEGQKLTVPFQRLAEFEDQIRRLKERGEPIAEDLRRFGEKAVRDLLDPMPLEGGEKR